MSEPTEQELFEAKLEYRAELGKKIKVLEDEKKTIDAELIPGLFARGLTEYRIPFSSIKIETKTTRTIDKAKLVARGVEVGVIDESTDVSVSEPYLRYYPTKT